MPIHIYVLNPARIRLRTFKSRAERLVREAGSSTHASAAKEKNGSPRSMKLPDVEAAMSQAKHADLAAACSAEMSGGAAADFRK